jgi:putative endonuclease
MAQHNDVGKIGEAKAIAYLKEQGYRIRQVNWRKSYPELDIVAQTPEELVFVEVKTRRNPHASPAEAVHDKKIRHLMNAAEDYLRQSERMEWHVRFDTIFVVGDASSVRIEHTQDAFHPPLYTHGR